VILCSHPMTIQQYVEGITKKYRSGITTGQLFQEYLKILIQSSAPDVIVANGPAEAACGSPDYIILKRDFPVGYLVLSDIDKPLDGQGLKKDLDLCKKSLSNLILTNCLEFHRYRDGVLKSCVSIAEIQHGKIVSGPGNHPSAGALIKEFFAYKRAGIDSTADLSVTMARKAQILACALENAINQDEREGENKNHKTSGISLKEQLADVDIALKINTPARDLANIYAQTISYGMFAARLYGGPALKEFSRQNAAGLIPLSYPYLIKLFRYLAGPDLDERIAWIINEIADVFRVTDVAALVNEFKRTPLHYDPFDHFHETFLDGYDPKFQESRGVSHKPEPIVAFLAETVGNCIPLYRS
jgi:hypothetical protein